MDDTEKSVKQYLERVTALSPEDTPGFHQAIREGLELGVVTDEFLAHRINTSRTSVARWRDGRSAPHPAMRSGIIGLIRREAEAKLGQK